MFPVLCIGRSVNGNLEILHILTLWSWKSCIHNKWSNTLRNPLEGILLLELLWIQGAAWDVWVKGILGEFILTVESLWRIQTKRREERGGHLMLGQCLFLPTTPSSSLILLWSCSYGNQKCQCASMWPSNWGLVLIYILVIFGYISCSVFSLLDWDLYSEVKERAEHFSECCWLV